MKKRSRTRWRRRRPLWNTRRFQIFWWWGRRRVDELWTTTLICTQQSSYVMSRLLLLYRLRPCCSTGSAPRLDVPTCSCCCEGMSGLHCLDNLKSSGLKTLSVMKRVGHIQRTGSWVFVIWCRYKSNCGCSEFKGGFTRSLLSSSPAQFPVWVNSEVGESCRREVEDSRECPGASSELDLAWRAESSDLSESSAELELWWTAGRTRGQILQWDKWAALSPLQSTKDMFKFQFSKVCVCVCGGGGGGGGGGSQESAGCCLASVTTFSRPSVCCVGPNHRSRSRTSVGKKSWKIVLMRFRKWKWCHLVSAGHWKDQQPIRCSERERSSASWWLLPQSGADPCSEYRTLDRLQCFYFWNIYRKWGKYLDCGRKRTHFFFVLLLPGVTGPPPPPPPMVGRTSWDWTTSVPSLAPFIQDGGLGHWENTPGLITVMTLQLTG